MLVFSFLFLGERSLCSINKKHDFEQDPAALFIIFEVEIEIKQNMQQKATILV
jgi:hypothetical protein